MAAIVWQNVVDVAPELADPAVPVALQTLWLALANQDVNVSLFYRGEDDPRLALARAYLVAHFGSGYGEGSGGAAGPVTSESAGGLSRSYAQAMAAGGGILGTTVYGQNFLALVRPMAGGPFLPEW